MKRSEQQIVELLAIVPECADLRAPAQAALDRAAELLGAEAGVAVCGEEVLAASGIADGEEPAALVHDVRAAFGARALRLATESAERGRLLERLARIQRSIVRRSELQEVLDAITAGARELMGDDVAVLRLLDAEDPEALLLASCSGMEADMAASIRRSSARYGASGRAFATGEMVVVDDYQGFRSALEALAPLAFSAAIAAPVRENGRLIGSFVVASRRLGRRYTAGERDVLLAFAEHASLALTDARNFSDAMRRVRHDPLTGLPNRALLLERLAGGEAAEPRAVLFLDLDDFKRVNDTLGHPVGDQLLRLVAERLREAVRPEDTIARLGGDEFAIVLDGAPGLRAAEAVARRLLAALEPPFPLAGQEARIGASIGIVRDVGDAAALLRDADVAMYEAKGRGRGCFAVFRPAMRAAAVERAELTDALRGAAERGELRVHYQPVVELGGGRVAGFEALLRWQHPSRGLLPPAAFVPLAEESGEIVALGRWILSEACRQAARWRTRAPALAVNLSVQQLRDDGIVEDVRRALTESGLPGEALTLEITETVLMAHTEATLRRLRELKLLGVRIAVDDFGTGYSSLQYLAQFPIDALKIPKPFVDHVADGEEHTTLARAIVYLARNFGLGVVAEGIETAVQRAALARLGCPLGQGYLFARPLEPAAAHAWLGEHPGGRALEPAA